jgi:hypothetical protein
MEIISKIYFLWKSENATFLTWEPGRNERPVWKSWKTTPQR